jgi:hypothetical protein
LILEASDSHLVKDEWVFWRDLEGLREEPFGQLRVVRQSVLNANVKQGKVTSSGKLLLYSLEKPKTFLSTVLT